MNQMTKRTHAPPGFTPWGEDVQEFLRDFWGQDRAGSAGLLSPAVDVSEDATALRVSAELPGIDKKDITVEVQDGVLAIRAEKRQESEQKDRNALRIERRYGSIYRALSLPQTVDASKIDASMKNGVLTVLIPKREETKPRAITIKE